MEENLSLQLEDQYAGYVDWAISLGLWEFVMDFKWKRLRAMQRG